MLRVFEVETLNGTEWLLSDDAQSVTNLAQACNWIVVADHEPASILAREYQGIACLSLC